MMFDQMVIDKQIPNPKRVLALHPMDLRPRFLGGKPVKY